MKKIIILLLIPFISNSQGKIKEYIPSAIFTFLGGASDGLRDASNFRMQNANLFWNGRQSWKNKYKNKDINQGPAYLGSTSFLVWTTDAPHLSNMLTHQFNGMAMAYMPQDNNKKLGHVFLKVLAYNAVRQVGHSLVYGLLFKPK